MLLKKKSVFLVTLCTLTVYLLIQKMRPVLEKRVSQSNTPSLSEASSLLHSVGVDVFEAKWTYEYTSSLCTEDNNVSMAEDLLCKKRPELLRNYKNPCWKTATVRRRGEPTVECMPYFHLLGVDKCGSTDLFERILQHPEMEPPFCSVAKECYYWAWKRYGIYMRNNSMPDWKTFQFYLTYFKEASKSIELREVDGYHSHITGEGTPMDLWDFRGWSRIPQNRHRAEPLILTPHLIKHMYHHPRLLIILRNPTDRLYSDYYFLSYGHSPEAFHKHAGMAIDLLQGCEKKRTLQQCVYDMDLYRLLPMRIQVSCYSIFIKEWLRVIPRESFLVLRSEDYGHDIKKHLKMVFNFLNISRLPEEVMDFISNSKRKHVTREKTNKGPMLDKTRDMLNKFFEPFNKELALLLQDSRFLWKHN